MASEQVKDSDRDIKFDENIWMVRPCKVYEDEYKDCRSIRARFHQYFVHGKLLDCTQWKHDIDNCYKWTDNEDIKARNALIQSEIARRLDRLRGHYRNDVWKRREAPPQDWSKPLPDEFNKEYETSYLNIKSKELRGEITPVIQESYCAIL